MKHYEGDNIDNLYRLSAKDIQQEGKIQSSRTEPTKELRHVTYSIKNPRDRVVFSRPINPAFAITEVLWILAGRSDEHYLHFWNPRMRQWANEDGDLSGYGYRLREHFEIDQLSRAREILRTDEHSRQVVLQIWDPVEDLPNPHPRSNDVPCNISSHLLVRDGELHWLQVMRSNDLIWGTPYNIIQFTILQEILAGWIGTNVGTYDHISSSLHVYQRHWDHLQTIARAPAPPETSIPDLRVSKTEWDEFSQDLFNIPNIMKNEQNISDVERIIDDHSHFPEGYRQWVVLLGAEALRRNGAKEDAWNLIHRAGEYWAESWKRWANDNN